MTDDRVECNGKVYRPYSRKRRATYKLSDEQRAESHMQKLKNNKDRLARYRQQALQIRFEAGNKNVKICECGKFYKNYCSRCPKKHKEQ